LSSCLEDTILNGINYLKGQEPVRAKKDSEYPSWLWTIQKPKEYPEDGPGGKAEKVRLRAANRQRIKEKNFLKTQ
jgi:large subunit ribosomal protein L54